MIPYNRGNRRDKRRRYWRKAADLLIAFSVIILAGYLAWHQDQQQQETAAPIDTITGPAEISDGDSIRIHGQRIRIAGIDAPELHQFCEKDSRQFACGKKSMDYLEALIGNRPVTCRWFEKDQYDRILGHCTAGETDLNRTMVADGWAVSYSSYPEEERAARRYKRGMWRWNVQRPYHWRRAHPRQDTMQKNKTHSIQ